MGWNGLCCTECAFFVDEQGLALENPFQYKFPTSAKRVAQRRVSSGANPDEEMLAPKKVTLVLCLSRTKQAARLNAYGNFWRCELSASVSQYQVSAHGLATCHFPFAAPSAVASPGAASFDQE
jgi:hypothetical protein